MSCHTIIEELDLSRVMTVAGSGSACSALPFPTKSIVNLASTAFQRLQTLRLAGNGITACDMGNMIGEWEGESIVSGGVAVRMSCTAVFRFE